MPKIRNDMIKNNCAKKPYRKQNPSLKACIEGYR